LCPEAATERHNKFVTAVCSIFKSTNSGKHTFEVAETCLDNDKGAILPLKRRKVYFDIFLRHTIKESSSSKVNRIIIECKTRENCNSASISSLKNDFKIFILKCYESMDYLKSTYRENYIFLFITNIFFGINNDDLTFEFLKEQLDEISKKDNDKISLLTQKLKIIVFIDWFTGIVLEG
jgi:hypothetical protein